VGDSVDIAVGDSVIGCLNIEGISLGESVTDQVGRIVPSGVTVLRGLTVLLSVAVLLYVRVLLGVAVSLWLTVPSGVADQLFVRVPLGATTSLGVIDQLGLSVTVPERDTGDTEGVAALDGLGVGDSEGIKHVLQEIVSSQSCQVVLLYTSIYIDDTFN